MPTGQHFVEAVPVLGHQQHHGLAVGVVGHLPLICGQVGGDLPEPPAQLVDAERHGIGADLLTGEKPARLSVGVIRGLGDPAADVGQKRGDACDDAGAVGTTQRQHEAMIVNHGRHRVMSALRA